MGHDRSVETNARPEVMPFIALERSQRAIVARRIHDLMPVDDRVA